MNKPNVIYQFFDSTCTLLKFPYPPVYRDDGTDYLCFCMDKSVYSTNWQMVYVDDLKCFDIESYLKKYEQAYEINTNQIQIASIFSTDDISSALVTVPDFSELPDITFDKTKLVPTKNEHGGYAYKRNPVYTDGPYNGRPLLLTIGVPVSNQIKTIDRCLSHIKPLLDELDSELLVINTGSTDGTLDVCRKYNARIVEFQWCDNMSAARNTGIYNARGLWYMSIDDDEWFEDVSEILTFFKSPACLETEAAFYIQRNYTYSGRTDMYTDVVTYRMGKITPGLHFEGRIHDALVHEGNIKGFYFNDYVHHYGFVHDTKETSWDKYKRNVSILLYDLYEYPTNSRYNFQLANELNVIGSFDAASAYFWRGLSIALETKDTYYDKNNATSLISIAHKRDSQKLYGLVKTFEKKYSFAAAEKAYFYSAIAEVEIAHKGSYEQALEGYKLYLQYLDEYNSEPLKNKINVYTGTHVCNVDIFINYTHAIAFCAYVGLGKINDAFNELDLIKVSTICRCPQWFFDHLCLAGTSAIEIVLQKLPAAQRDGAFEMLLTGVVNSVEQMEADEFDSSVLGTILSFYNCDFIKSYLSVKGMQIPKEFWWKLYNSKSLRLALKQNNILIQLKYFYVYVAKMCFGETSDSTENMDIFIEYIRHNAEFAISFYNPNLLGDSHSMAIDAEIRASVIIWQACNETSIYNMVKLLKDALNIYPDFYAEIKKLLAVVNVND